MLVVSLTNHFCISSANSPLISLPISLIISSVRPVMSEGESSPWPVTLPYASTVTLVYVPGVPTAASASVTSSASVPPPVRPAPAIILRVGLTKPSPGPSPPIMSSSSLPSLALRAQPDLSSEYSSQLSSMSTPPPEPPPEPSPSPRADTNSLVHTPVFTRSDATSVSASFTSISAPSAPIAPNSRLKNSVSTLPARLWYSCSYPPEPPICTLVVTDPPPLFGFPICFTFIISLSPLMSCRRGLP